MILKYEEKKSLQNSCYDSDVMKNNQSKECVPSFMQCFLQPRLIDMIVLQNCTNSEKGVRDPCGETYSTSDDADEVKSIQAGVSSAEEDEEPVPIEFLEIKAEPTVSCNVCVCPLSGICHKYEVCQLSF
jgi:hypothetical protein